MEKVVPIYAEEVVVSKRLVEVAEVRIRKRKVTQVKKSRCGQLNRRTNSAEPEWKQVVV